jgi:ABC-type sugar transport system ATPase subunit
VEIDGRPMPLGSIKQAMRRRIGLVPEDRKRQGLVLMMSGRSNYSLATLDRLRRFGLLDSPHETRQAAQSFARLRVKTPTLETPVAVLSGGNQQKVVIAKWLARDARILIVDEPTRGVDVGAKAAIHQLLDELAGRGVAILLISSELPELCGMASRILVMREGKLAGELPRDSSEETILRLMAGVA